MYVVPLAPHVYESHAVIDVLVEVLLLIVKSKEATLSQPAALVVVYVYIPLACGPLATATLTPMYQTQIQGR